MPENTLRRREEEGKMLAFMLTPKEHNAASWFSVKEKIIM